MIPLIADHLWQSTWFAAAAALVALGLRANRAEVRYRIWLVASMKFLVPFAALAAAGAAVAARWLHPAGWLPPAAGPQLAVAVDAVSQPFTQSVLIASTPGAGNAAAPSFPWLAVLIALWLVGVITVSGRWWIAWRRVAAVARSGIALNGGREIAILAGLGGRLPIVECDSTLEPGIFGIRGPVLLWPRGISAHLSDEQIAAILSHELEHLRRRDNLSAAIHMAVQALFWFHPIVWWIGARLVRERERACDEHVLRAGRTPHLYAESILRTCEFYTGSPLACVSGVTGSNLKQRIEDIMRVRAATALSPFRKVLLTTAALLTIAAPLAFGGLDARQESPTVAFDVASVKPNESGEGRVSIRMLPGGAYEATNVTVRALIQQAYRMSNRQVLGGPSWIDTARFDILAKSPQGALQSEFPDRLRNLLEERLKLTTHRETREMPIYALVRANRDGSLGPRITPTTTDCTAGAARARGPSPSPPAAAGTAGGRQMTPPSMPALGSEPRPCSVMFSPTGYRAGGRTMAEIASMLQTNAGRIVHDRTGISGSFDFDLEFTPDPALQSAGPGGGLPASPDAPRPVEGDRVSIFTAIQEQLGLRLEATTGPVEVLVIDSVERPEAN